MSNLLLILLMAAMPFFYPMWDNESQRIGMKMCTPFGYMLHGIAELLGFVCFLLLLGTCAYLIYEWIVGGFHLSLLWLLAMPYVAAYVGRILDWCSWMLAKWKGFHYDYDKREASWMEYGQRRIYNYRTEK